MLKIASPEQSICYGDTVTSCTTLTILMEDGWKIGAHINPLSYYKADVLGDTTIQKQTINPTNLVSKCKEILDTNEHFKDNKIKSIYLLGDSGTFWSTAIINEETYEQVGYVANSSAINNNNSKERLKAANKYVNEADPSKGTIMLTTLRSDNGLDFFKFHFGGEKFVKNVSFTLSPYTTIKAGSSNPKGQHFIVKADGSLDLIQEN